MTSYRDAWLLHNKLLLMNFWLFFGRLRSKTLGSMLGRGITDSFSFCGCLRTIGWNAKCRDSTRRLKDLTKKVKKFGKNRWCDRKGSQSSNIVWELIIFKHWREIKLCNLGLHGVTIIGNLRSHPNRSSKIWNPNIFWRWRDYNRNWWDSVHWSLVQQRPLGN